MAAERVLIVGRLFTSLIGPPCLPLRKVVLLACLHLASATGINGSMTFGDRLTVPLVEDGEVQDGEVQDGEIQDGEGTYTYSPSSFSEDHLTQWGCWVQFVFLDLFGSSNICRSGTRRRGSCEAPIKNWRFLYTVESFMEANILRDGDWCHARHATH